MSRAATSCIGTAQPWDVEAPNGLRRTNSPHRLLSVTDDPAAAFRYPSIWRDARKALLPMARTQIGQSERSLRLDRHDRSARRSDVRAKASSGVIADS